MSVLSVLDIPSTHVNRVNLRLQICRRIQDAECALSWCLLKPQVRYNVSLSGHHGSLDA